jgi:hypothetical protein
LVDKPVNPERTIIFADGCFAVLGDLYEDEEKNETVFMFRPTPRMRWKNKIEDKEYDEVYDWIVKRYATDLCICLDASPDYQTWLLFCNYRGVECNLTKKIDQELLKKVEAYRNESKVLSNLMKIRFNKLNKIVKHSEEFKTELIEEMIKQKKAVSSGIEDLDKGDI